VIDTGSSGEPPLTRGFVGGSGMGGFSVVEPLPAAPAPPVRLHRGIRPPVKIRDVMPEYPMAATLSGAQGVVVVEVIIDAAGSVEAAKVLRPIHPLLDRAALEAVRAWRFSPAMLNDTPIPVVMTVTVHFTLQR
jgi:TonB family protein